MCRRAFSQYLLHSRIARPCAAGHSPSTYVTLVSLGHVPQGILPVHNLALVSLGRVPQGIIPVLTWLSYRSAVCRRAFSQFLPGSRIARPCAAGHSPSSYLALASLGRVPQGILPVLNWLSYRSAMLPINNLSCLLSSAIELLIADANRCLHGS
jgi:hypothetical protein